MSRELRNEAVERERERERRDERELAFAEDLRALAGTAAGRRFFRWLIDQGNLFADDYAPGPLAGYQAGLKAVPRRLWRRLEDALPPEAFIAIVGKEKKHE